eukprot:1708679-Amphidinium_carterae.1
MQHVKAILESVDNSSVTTNAWLYQVCRLQQEAGVEVGVRPSWTHHIHLMIRARSLQRGTHRTLAPKSPSTIP